jgi:predicted PurR-regulated permease PerM
MWGFLIGLYIAILIYPFFEEWQQRRVDKRRLRHGPPLGRDEGRADR